MPTTLFNFARILLASTSFSTDLMQHQDLQIRLYHWHHFHFGMFWYSIIISAPLLPLTSFHFYCFDTASPARTKTDTDFLVACMGWVHCSSATTTWKGWAAGARTPEQLTVHPSFPHLVSVQLSSGSLRKQKGERHAYAVSFCNFLTMMTGWF